MRYPPGQKQRTRERILDAAARVYRRDGFQGGSVDRVMAEAGLTPGGFYSHFESKEALFAEALARALEPARTIFGEPSAEPTPAERLTQKGRRYLSRGHLERGEEGCPLPQLLSELPRAGEEARRGFEQAVLRVAETMRDDAVQVGDKDPDQALALLSLMVGGMALARAVPSPRLSYRILLACRRLFERSMQPEPDPSPAAGEAEMSPLRRSPSDRSPTEPGKRRKR